MADTMVGEEEMKGGDGPPPDFKKSEECGEPAVYLPPGIPEYSVFDVDGSGTVEYKEVDETADKLPHKPPQFVVDAVKEMMDKDTSKTVSKDEFCEFGKKM